MSRLDGTCRLYSLALILRSSKWESYVSQAVLKNGIEKKQDILRGLSKMLASWDVFKKCNSQAYEGSLRLLEGGTMDSFGKRERLSSRNLSSSEECDTFPGNSVVYSLLSPPTFALSLKGISVRFNLKSDM